MSTTPPYYMSTTPPSLENICAIIVTYHPDEEFSNRLLPILMQFALVIIVDNGSRPTLIDKILNKVGKSQIHLISNQMNLGIATALNQGVETAIQNNFKWIVTLDQDTLVASNMLTSLLDVYVQSDGCNRIIGSNYWDSNRKRNFKPSMDAGFLERKTLITSGTLIPLSLFKKIGYFRDDYFIDSVDHEFCLRARSQGYKILMTKRSIMSQSIGSHIDNPSRLRQFMSFNHSPVRKYFIARNTIFTAQTYFLQEPVWSVRQVWRLISDFASIILFEHEKFKRASAFMVGITHGITGKMGPIEKTWPDGLR